MSLAKDGIMVVLSSPSGAGKTTLVKKISLEKSYKISISHTTRKPRTNETDGKDYFFVSVVFPAPDGEDKINIMPFLSFAIVIVIGLMFFKSFKLICFR